MNKHTAFARISWNTPGSKSYIDFFVFSYLMTVIIYSLCYKISTASQAALSTDYLSFQTTFSRFAEVDFPLSYYVMSSKSFSPIPTVETRKESGSLVAHHHALPLQCFILSIITTFLSCLYKPKISMNLSLHRLPLRMPSEDSSILTLLFHAYALFYLYSATASSAVVPHY